MYCSGRGLPFLVSLDPNANTLVHKMSLFLPATNDGNQYFYRKPIFRERDGKWARWPAVVCSFWRCTQESRPHYRKQLGSDRNHLDIGRVRLVLKIWRSQSRFVPSGVFPMSNAIIGKSTCTDFDQILSFTDIFFVFFQKHAVKMMCFETSHLNHKHF